MYNQLMLMLTAIQFSVMSVRVTAGWRGRKLVYLSDRLVASSMLPEQL